MGSRTPWQGRTCVPQTPNPRAELSLKDGVLRSQPVPTKRLSFPSHFLQSASKERYLPKPSHDTPSPPSLPSSPEHVKGSWLSSLNVRNLLKSSVSIFSPACHLLFCLLSVGLTEDNMRTASIAAGVSVCILVIFVLLLAIYVYLR